MFWRRNFSPCFVVLPVSSTVKWLFSLFPRKSLQPWWLLSLFSKGPQKTATDSFGLFLHILRIVSFGNAFHRLTYRFFQYPLVILKPLNPQFPTSFFFLQMYLKCWQEFSENRNKLFWAIFTFTKSVVGFFQCLLYTLYFINASFDVYLSSKDV